MADEERVGARVLYLDEPSKTELFQLDALYSIISNENAWRGFVTWDASPPPSIAYHLHKFDILDAFQTGFAFLRTRFTDEWALLGPVAVAIVRTLPVFIEDDPKPFGRCILIGRIGRMKVYADPSMADPREWFVGCHGECVKGIILNKTTAFR